MLGSLPDLLRLQDNVGGHKQAEEWAMIE